jgi:uncharacterized protein YjbI with pentapeptide repeats
LTEIVLQGCDLSGRDAGEVRLSEIRLKQVDLSGSTLTGAGFADAIVEDGSWANVRASRATLVRLEAHRLRATGADLAEAGLKHVRLEGCRFDLASFRFARLERVVFRDCRLEEADFYGARLSSVVFEGGSLAQANFAGAELERCELRGCDLTELHGVEGLRGARLPIGDVVQIAGLLASAAGIVVE